MIVLLSPAKTLDYNDIDYPNHSMPRMLSESEALVNVLKKKSARSIKKLMNVSDQIAELNVERYQNYNTPFTPDNAKQAIFAFKGDVYLGLQAESFDETDLNFAQDHLRILSGLYGLLKPLDLMQAYRLEMGTKLKRGRKKNLYEFWDSKITKLINKDLEETGNEVILNLASKEYFHSVKPAQLAGKLIHIHFKENRNGTFKVISFNAKKARGSMAHQIIKNKLLEVEPLKNYNVDGYTFNEGLSDVNNFTFTK